MTRSGSDEQGFTLVELLIVMAIVGILAAIAAPTLLSMRSRAYIASVKSDVTAITKAVNAAYVDGSRTLIVEDDGQEWRLVHDGKEVARGPLSEHNTVSDTSYVLASGDYCLAVSNARVDAEFWTADNTSLRAGDCTPPGPSS